MLAREHLTLKLKYIQKKQILYSFPLSKAVCYERLFLLIIRPLFAYRLYHTEYEQEWWIQTKINIDVDLRFYACVFLFIYII